MVRIKFCGIKDIRSAKVSVEAGADAIGFVFANSKRKVTPEQAKDIIDKLPPYVTTVGVFVNEKVDDLNKISRYCKLDLVQLHGGEDIQYCKNVERPIVKAIGVRNISDLEKVYEYDRYVSGILLDAYAEGTFGGTGHTFPWEYISTIRNKSKLIIAGGLHIDNVEKAILQTNPYAVDVSSGIEHKGIKDASKMYEFVSRVRNCGI
ncbi:phosphoribosylanthranilate isomerase [Priestia aryabhattai]|uniref:phosphoribosylanthranilate isomerase n=1 Tax=Priestia megaterium TaxID=1404 RepID=UPI0039B85128